MGVIGGQAAAADDRTPKAPGGSGSATAHLVFNC